MFNLKIPGNRVVAFVGPYIAVGAGGAVAFVVAKLNAIGFPGLGEHQHELATGLTAAGLWLLTSALAWAGHSKWLTGHHIELMNEGNAAAAALSSSSTPLESPRTLIPGVVEHTLIGDTTPQPLLVSDEEEFAAPPNAERPEGGRVPDAPAED